MGSFNTLCAVSHQVIVPDEEVYLIPLVQNHTSTKIEYATQDGVVGITNGVPDRVYNFDMYKVVGVMLEATYADYGRFDLIKSESNFEVLDQFINILKEDLINVEQGDNKYHEKAFNVSLLEDKTNLEIWEVIQDGLHSNRIYLHTPLFNLTNEPANVSLMVVSKRSMDLLFKMWDERKPYYSYDKKYEEVMSLDLAGRFKFYLNNLKTLVEDETYPTNLYFSEIRENNYLFLDTMRENGCTSLSSTSFLKYFISLFQASRDKDTVFQVFISYHRLKQLVDIFQSFNITPSPMWYAPQDYGNTSGLLYSRFMHELYELNIVKARDYLKEEEGTVPDLSDEEVIENALNYF